MHEMMLLCVSVWNGTLWLSEILPIGEQRRAEVFDIKRREKERCKLRGSGVYLEKENLNFSPR